MRPNIASGVLLIVGASAANAQSDNLAQVACELGMLLASKQPCKLEYDQEAFITYSANAPQGTHDFISMMKTYAYSTERELSEFGAPQLTARCIEVNRLAKARGFIQ